jgi:Cu-Zn family superoxide dismutase
VDAFAGVTLTCSVQGGSMKLALGSLAIGALVAGCATMEPSGNSAVADLAPTAGNTAKGTVTFLQKGDRVLVVAKVSGLAPGNHGFHIHEKGDCSAADAMSAGGHFNPMNKPHAHPSVADRHTGDMPMLIADTSGNATLTTELTIMTIGAGANDIVGKGVIVHKDPDDFTTQPTGNSGARVACGVIRKA